MSTDRELLELAANAAGLALSWRDWGDFGLQPMAAKLGEVCAGPTTWNPLTDDGDALRLAVKLNIEVAYFDDKQEVNAGVWSPSPDSWDCMTPYNGEKQAATRRAIVRAAAEIGKDMK